MSKEDIIRLVIWTMQNYGSDTGERKEPGSKLRSQAEHIAEVITEFELACDLTCNLHHIRIAPRID